ncbi:hypothetical protein A7Q09_07640 [Methylacidiphilum sp. Yel]|uniref:hypothetical protein n=1 Tax=Methylacidiphilum sp. Yel TaxID=1847730 RepID=UPI0010697B99|nr:hypothetical protein [Methylacidiphilum sp. Yel]TFE67970.1 hypothetical protein A7Q09_07640 [Methylacidiphilum sp. Yel]
MSKKGQILKGTLAWVFPFLSFSMFFPFISNAKEIPDYLGKGSSLFLPFKRKESSYLLKNKTTTREQKPAASIVPKNPFLKSQEDLFVQGSFEKRFSYRTEKWIVLVCWLKPDGEISESLPIWIDKNKDGHYFLKASVDIGEEIQPNFGENQTVSLCQTLSLFHSDNGEIKPIASPIWIIIQSKDNKKEEIWTGEGGWEASSNLFDFRNVYSPFKSFLRNNSNPIYKKLNQYKWPDIVLFLQKNDDETNKQIMENPDQILLNFK